MALPVSLRVPWNPVVLGTPPTSRPGLSGTCSTIHYCHVRDCGVLDWKKRWRQSGCTFSVAGRALPAVRTLKYWLGRTTFTGGRVGSGPPVPGFLLSSKRSKCMPSCVQQRGTNGLTSASDEQRGRREGPQSSPNGIAQLGQWVNSPL